MVKDWIGSKPAGTDDYRKVIDDKNIDVVHISTPDHWHAKIAIEAMLAGKDVYCEKPLTLTIEKGQKICEVCRKVGSIFQVGTGARSSEHWHRVVALAGKGGQARLFRMTR